MTKKGFNFLNRIFKKVNKVFTNFRNAVYVSLRKLNSSIAAKDH